MGADNEYLYYSSDPETGKNCQEITHSIERQKQKNYF